MTSTRLLTLLAFLAERIARAFGWSLRMACLFLKISERTARHHRAKGHVVQHPRRQGRPPRPLHQEDLEAIESHLDARHGACTISALQLAFPNVPRRKLKVLRYEWQKANQPWRWQLDWKRSGVVWAMDFTILDRCFANGCDRLFVVRDLASGMTLAAGAAGSEAAAPVVASLYRLFDRHGPPLVLKCDNGPGFIAQRTKAVCAEFGVKVLYSPPRRPQYSGAVESAMGPLKAVLAELTELDLGGAAHGAVIRQEVVSEVVRILNAEPTPRDRGVPRETAWRSRSPITSEERAAFQAAVEARASARRAELGLSKEPVLTHRQESSIDRFGIREALVELEYLAMSRVGESQVVSSREAARN